MTGRGATRKKASRAIARSAVRRLQQTLGGLGLVLVLAGAVFALGQVWQMPIERVVFSGDIQRVAPEQLQAMVSGALDGGFLGVDLQRVREPIEQLPWVLRVVVKRHWPDSLEIQVTEQLPIARWGKDSYLNSRGEVFRPSVFEPIAELPHLAGPQGSQLPLMQHYQYMQERLQALQLEVAKLTMDERGSLRARLSNGSELVFGRGHMAEKLQRFLSVYAAELVSHARQIRAVDLRYNHGLAVAWLAG